MKNEDVFEDFASGREAHTEHAFSEREGSLLVCYSYGRHFPMAIKLPDAFVLNRDKYSITTSKHQTGLLRAISGGRILTRTTKEIKAIIDALKGNEYPCENDLILLEL
jgi:hypothetical protein